MSDHWSPPPPPPSPDLLRDALWSGAWIGLVFGIVGTLVMLWTFGMIHLPSLRIGCS